MILVISVLAIVAVAVILGLTLRGRTEDDGVDSFRRQIDALSPEARKPTVDRVKLAEQHDDDDDDWSIS
jgi:hypothetical protein|tara:strand:- start:3229 stop:3435 length:207 start_codon:yes stop_codon:yes gene_type:complete